VRVLALSVLLSAGALVSANFCEGEFLPDADYLGDSGVTCSEFAAYAYEQIGGRPKAWSHKSCALKYESSPIFLIWDYVAPQCCSTGVTKCDTISSPDLCLNPKDYEPDTKVFNFTCSYYKRYLEYSADIKSDDGRAGPWTASTCRQSSRIFDGVKAGKIMTYLGATFGCCGENEGVPLDVCSSKMGKKRKARSAAFYAAYATSSTASVKSVSSSLAQSSKLESRSAAPAPQEEQTVAGEFMNNIVESHVKSVQDIISKTTLKLRTVATAA